DRLHMAEHHGRRGPSAELVPDSMNFQPVVREDLATRDRLADPVHEDLGPAARQATEPSRPQPLQYFPQWALRHLGEVVDLRRAEAVDVDPWEVILDVSEQFLVPFQPEVRMQAALEQDLISA